MAEEQPQPETQDGDVMSVKFTLLGRHSEGLFIQDTLLLVTKFTTAEDFVERLTGVLAETAGTMAEKLARFRTMSAETVMAMAEKGEEGGEGVEPYNGKALDC